MIPASAFLSTRLRDGLAVLAGCAMPLAFAPFGWYPVAVLAPALLFVLWRGCTPAQALWRGWLFGLGMFGSGVYWVYISIHVFGNTPAPLSALITVLFICLMAGFPALLGYAAARFVPTAGTTREILLLPAGWALLEWVRGWFLTGFPWLSLGYSQIDAPLAGLAPVLGVFGVSWATALSSGLLAAATRAGSRVRIAAAAGFVLLWSGAWLLGKAQFTQPDGEALRVSLLQGNISQAVKWKLEQRDPTLELYRALTREHWDSDVIVWPETAIPVFFDQVADEFLPALEREAHAHGTDLLIGVPVIDGDEWRYYNAMMSLGSGTAFYYKRHLVPFGEYLPLRDYLGELLRFLHIPMSDFSAGEDGQPLLQAAGRKVGISICYEDAFGEEVIQDLPEASLLVNVSNDAWFGDSLAPHQHLQIARMRALETGRFMLRATNTGISAIIDPAGTVVDASPQFAIDVLTGTVQPRAGATPYVRVGNAAVVAGTIVVLLIASAAARRARG